ncbi:MAG: hypothetical protein C4586_05670 [Anaerolineaceae bacterium]|nr:MAG: hypothetical protein C4586_05670 [Anaerolineaceae bacterium]
MIVLHEDSSCHKFSKICSDGMIVISSTYACELADRTELWFLLCCSSSLMIIKSVVVGLLAVMESNDFKNCQEQPGMDSISTTVKF